MSWALRIFETVPRASLAKLTVSLADLRIGIFEVFIAWHLRVGCLSFVATQQDCGMDLTHIAPFSAHQRL
jgi:hypothetical protein